MSKSASSFSVADIQVTFTPGVTSYSVVTPLTLAGESPWSNEVVVTAV